jgi:hypothetical protein
MGWLVWAVVLWLTSHHPSIPSRPKISPGRKWFALFAILMLGLAFTPTPITGASLREKWPALRDEGARGAHFLRDQSRRWLHRK